MYHDRLKRIGWIIASVFLLMYTLFQGRFFITGPVLNLEEPASISQASSTIIVIGRVSHAVLVTVNGYPMDIDVEGNLHYPLVIPDGYSILTVTARDRYGRTKTETRELFLRTP